MEEIKIISSNKDGAELRREKISTKYTVRCDGKADDEEIQDALSEAGTKKWFGLGTAWDRVFGGKP
jgi:hypothetical protein